MSDKELSMSDVATLAQVNKSTVSRWIKAGKFPRAQRIDGQWSIPLDDVLAAGVIDTVMRADVATIATATEEQVQRVAELENQLALMQKDLQHERELKKHLQEQIESQKLALRVADNALKALEAPQSQGESPMVSTENQEKEKPRFFRRLFGL